MFRAIRQNEEGFTFIEVAVAVFVILTAFVGTLGVIQKTISAVTFSSYKLTASHLAQEGIEIVRQMRDTNWVEKKDDPSNAWDENIPVGDWRADYTTLGVEDPTLNHYSGQKLKVDSDGYNYSSGRATHFKRRISISKPNAYEIQVEVMVEFRHGGATHSLIAEETLFNWR